MATVKNTGNQPHGFNTAEGGHVIVQPGETAEFNLTDADYKFLSELIEGEDPKPYELSGSAGGVKNLNPKEQREADAKKAEKAAEEAKEEAKREEAKVPLREQPRDHRR